MRLTQSRTACERWHRSRPVSSASWTALVCAFRGLHKTGVPLRPHLFLMGPGPCVGQRLAGVRGQSAPQNRGISDWRPSLWSWEPGLFHHHVPLRVGVGSSPRGSFPAVISFLPIFSGIAYDALIYQLQSQDHGTPPLLPQDPGKGRFMPIVQMDHLGRPGWCFSFSVSGLGQGRQAPLDTWPWG